LIDVLNVRKAHSMDNTHSFQELKDNIQREMASISIQDKSSI